MSFVIAAPQTVAVAASDLASIGSTISAANAAAANPTTAVIPAAADEVSAAISSLFENYAGEYQALSAGAAAFHNQFVQLMNTSAGKYAAAEAANASPLQTSATPSHLPPARHHLPARQADHWQCSGRTFKPRSATSPPRSEFPWRNSAPRPSRALTP